MTTEDIYKRIAQLSGKTVSGVMLFCRNKYVSANDLNTFFISQSRFPTDAECARIRQSGASYIKTLTNG